MGSSLVRLYQEKFEIEVKMNDLTRSIRYEQNKANSGIPPNKYTIAYLQTCLNAYSHLYKAVKSSISEKKEPVIPLIFVPKKQYVLESVVVHQV
uniref:Uncharacterized protein n=1 Tax=viral metagenome TaxID=1070528 RepID=A0A6C0I791_9ZZZZ